MVIHVLRYHKTDYVIFIQHLRNKTLKDGFWFHRKCFKCFVCKQLLVFSGDNYREIDNNYYCQSCAPQTANQNSSLLAKIDEEMTEPQKQDIVDKIIENTNVPVKPKPMVRNHYYVMAQLKLRNSLTQ